MENLQSDKIPSDSLERLSRAFVNSECEKNAISLIDIIFKAICHNDKKIREQSFSTLQKFCKPLQNYQKEIAPHLVTIIKGPFYQECYDLFNLGKHIYILKVVSIVIKFLGKELHNDCVLQKVTTILLKGFNSGPDMVICALVSWEALIENFALDLDYLTAKIDFIFQPFRYLKFAKVNTYPFTKKVFWFFITCFENRLSDNFEQVVLPVLEYFLHTTLKFDTILPFHIPLDKGSNSSGLKCAAEILIRILEQRGNAVDDSFTIDIAKLGTPVDSTVLFYHFKAILKSAKIVFSFFENDKSYESLLSALFASLLHLVSQEYQKTENFQNVATALSSLLNILKEATHHQTWSSHLCSVCLKKFIDFPLALLSMKYFPIKSCESGTKQNIAGILVSLLLQPHILLKLKTDKSALKQILSSSITLSHLPLTIVQTIICQLCKDEIKSILNPEELVNIWSMVATSLLEAVERTGEVNEGNNHDCDFSCFYAVLTYPLSYFMPPNISQKNFQRVQTLWTELVRTLHMNASLIPAVKDGTIINELCEKILPIVKKGKLENGFYFNSICVLLQILIEHTYSGKNEQSNSVSDDCINLFQRSQLGNSAAITNLLVFLLEKFYNAFSNVNIELAYNFQMTKYIGLYAYILQLVQSFVIRIKNSKLILQVISSIADPIACIFKIHHLNKDITPLLNSKLELFWQVFSTTIRHNYKGPFDENALHILTPLFEATLAHHRRNIMDKSRLFWLATFALTQPSLKISDSLKQALIKAKIPGHTEAGNNTVFDEMANIGSMSQSSLDCTAIISLPKQNSANQKKVTPKLTFNPSSLRKDKPQQNIDEIPEEEFVKISSAVPIRITKRRRTKKSFVPAMYNDLSKSYSDSLLELSEQSEFDTTSNDRLLCDEKILPPAKKRAVDSEIPTTPTFSSVSEENNYKSPSNLPEEKIECYNVTLVPAASSSVCPTNKGSLSGVKRRKSYIPTKYNFEKKFMRKSKPPIVKHAEKFKSSNNLKLAIRDSLRREKLKQNTAKESSNKLNIKCERMKRVLPTNIKKTSDKRTLGTKFEKETLCMEISSAEPEER